MAAAAEGRSFWKRRRGSGGKVRGGRGTGTLEAARDRGAAAEGGIGIEGEGRKARDFYFRFSGGLRGVTRGKKGCGQTTRSLCHAHEPLSSFLFHMYIPPCLVLLGQLFPTDVQRILVIH
jgi:hypothetical protein